MDRGAGRIVLGEHHSSHRTLHGHDGTHYQCRSPKLLKHINKLLAETVEDPINPPEMRNSPRDGLHPSPSEPIFMTFEPGDIEVTVAASIESDMAEEEIVDNKTVRVDGEEQPSGTPGDHKICRGCTTVAHTLDSCPTLTNCQQYRMGQTEPTSAGVDQLSVSFENLAKSSPASPTGLTTPSTSQAPPTGSLNTDNTRTNPLSPAPAVQHKCKENAATPTQGVPSSSKQQPTSDRTKTSVAD